MSALDRRREGAVRAFLHVLPFGEVVDRAALERCVEVATTVQVTPGIIDAACAAVSAGNGARERYRRAIIAALRAAGFEVKE